MPLRRRYSISSENLGERLAMETIVDPKVLNSILNQWLGANAKIWLFHATHSRLAINLFRSGEQEAIYIMVVGCERIRGPFSWKKAAISVAVEQDEHGQVRHHVVDKQSAQQEW
jgi:hypothetical protein